MSVFKKLAGQTAIYGLSSIVARFLNYLLTPLYTGKDGFSPDQYGIITEMYAYIAFIMILLTYGMETSFFRFSTLKGNSKPKVFSTALTSLISTSLIFMTLAYVFSGDIAGWLNYEDHPEYIIWLAGIMAMDAISAVPMAKLRSNNQASKFAIINFVSVLVNIGLNLFFIVYCKYEYESPQHSAVIDLVYNPAIGVGYVFISNFIASGVKLLLLLPEFTYGRFKFDFALLKKMLPYALPLIVVGFAGNINETIDRVMLKTITMNEEIAKGTLEQAAKEIGQRENGIYGACYKITMIITLFLQAFRYASEPFFFNQEENNESKQVYARVMTYFVIVVSFCFLGIMLFLHFFKHFIPNPDYWEGLKVVPILLAANILLGIYFNLNIWFKLSGKTQYGALIATVGAAVTITLNWIYIPVYGYEACAWTTLIVYALMVILSYLFGRKHYPIPYNFRKIGLYAGLAAVLYLLSLPFDYTKSMSLEMGLYHGALLLVFIAIVLFLERPKKLVTSVGQ
jgi:O-antigen/teichoic acid export membrane protein